VLASVQKYVIKGALVLSLLQTQVVFSVSLL
jgi:hypothetical protein